MNHRDPTRDVTRLAMRIAQQITYDVPKRQIIDEALAEGWDDAQVRGAFSMAKLMIEYLNADMPV